MAEHWGPRGVGQEAPQSKGVYTPNDVEIRVGAPCHALKRPEGTSVVDKVWRQNEPGSGREQQLDILPRNETVEDESGGEEAGGEMEGGASRGERRDASDTLQRSPEAWDDASKGNQKLVEADLGDLLALGKDECGCCGGAQLRRERLHLLLVIGDFWRDEHQLTKEPRDCRIVLREDNEGNSRYKAFPNLRAQGNSKSPVVDLAKRGIRRRRGGDLGGGAGLINGTGRTTVRVHGGNNTERKG